LLFLQSATSAKEAICFRLPTLKERLACWDKNPSQTVDPEPNAPPPDAAKTALDDRRRFRHDLERRFLHIGLSMDIGTTGQGETTLLIFGYLSKAMVYQVAFEANILGEAKGLGFKRVDFDDKGDEGHWIFDLSKPGDPPRCDNANRVCR
jgi:hypothetical protein